MTLDKIASNDSREMTSDNERGQLSLIGPQLNVPKPRTHYFSLAKETST